MMWSWQAARQKVSIEHVSVWDSACICVCICMVCIACVSANTILESSIHHYEEEPDRCQYPSLLFQSIRFPSNRSTTYCLDWYSPYPYNIQQTVNFSPVSAAVVQLKWLSFIKCQRFGLLIWNQSGLSGCNETDVWVLSLIADLIAYFKYTDQSVGFQYVL